MSITFFTTGPQCHRCSIAAKHLDRRGLTYEKVDLNENIDQAIALRKQGFNLAPVIRAEADDGAVSWSEGYRPDFIDALAPTRQKAAS